MGQKCLLGGKKCPLDFAKKQDVLFHLFFGTSVFFLKTTNKLYIPCKITVTFYENCCSTIRGLRWILHEISPFYPLLFLVKTTKKTWCTFQKNRYVLWNLSFYYKGFSLNFCLKSHVCPFFVKKTTIKTRCTLQINCYVL